MTYSDWGLEPAYDFDQPESPDDLVAELLDDFLDLGRFVLDLEPPELAEIGSKTERQRIHAPWAVKAPAWFTVKGTQKKGLAVRRDTAAGQAKKKPSRAKTSKAQREINAAMAYLKKTQKYKAANYTEILRDAAVKLAKSQGWNGNVD